MTFTLNFQKCRVVWDKLVNDLKLPIDYCPHSRSYVYTEEGSFEIGFKKIPPNKAAKLNGGKSMFLRFF